MLLETFEGEWIDTENIISYYIEINNHGDYNTMARLKNNERYIIDAMFIKVWEAEKLIEDIATKIKQGKAYYRPRKDEKRCKT